MFAWIWTRVSTLWCEPDVWGSAPAQQSRAHLRALQDYVQQGQGEPTPEAQASTVRDYAIAMYQQTIAGNDLLDDKADKLIQTSGLAASILAGLVGALGLPAWVLVALVPWSLGIAIAVVIRRPISRARPGSAANFLEDLRAHPELAPHFDAYLAGSYEWATRATSVLNEWKGRRLWWAHWFLLAGILLGMLLAWAGMPYATPPAKS